MKSLTSAFLALAIIGCISANKNSDTLDFSTGVSSQVDTMLFVDSVIVDSVPFLKLQMNHNMSYITMADSVLPSQADSTIALCVEAAFTGELLKDFKSTNIGGDYVIDGIFHKGYKCTANTGFLYADKTVFTISSSEHCSKWIEKAQKNHGTVFQQILIIHNGKKVYKETPIKPATSNIYRSACIMNDGNFAVIQSKERVSLSDFIESLIKIGVSDALYLDMGRGWNYGWYRESTQAPAVSLFDYHTPCQTN